MSFLIFSILLLSTHLPVPASPAPLPPGSLEDDVPVSKKAEAVYASVVEAAARLQASLQNRVQLDPKAREQIIERGLRLWPEFDAHWAVHTTRDQATVTSSATSQGDRALKQQSKADNILVRREQFLHFSRTSFANSKEAAAHLKDCPACYLLGKVFVDNSLTTSIHKSPRLRASAKTARLGYLARYEIKGSGIGALLQRPNGVLVLESAPKHPYGVARRTKHAGLAWILDTPRETFGVECNGTIRRQDLFGRISLAGQAELAFLEPDLCAPALLDRVLPRHP